jgi:hypothetical protein
VQAVTLDELAIAQTDTMLQDFECHIKEKLSRGNNDLFVADVIPTRNVGEQDAYLSQWRLRGPIRKLMNMMKNCMRTG